MKILTDNRISKILATLLFFGLIISSILIIPTFTRAQGTNTLPQYTLLEPLPCVPSPPVKDVNGNEIPGSEVVCDQGELRERIDFRSYVQYAFNLFIALAAATAVFMIVYGGLQYMSTDSWQGKNAGLAKARNAVFGLLLVLASFLILRTIDPRLVDIPSALVPPLNIKVENIRGDFFNKLAQESQQFKLKVEDTKKQLTESESRNLERFKKLDELRSDRKEMLDFFALDENDPEVMELDEEIRQLEYEIAYEENTALLVVAKLELESVVYGISPSNGTTGIDWKIISERIDASYEQRLEKLQAGQAQPDQILSLMRYRDYSKMVVEINAEVAKVRQVQLNYDNRSVRTATDARIQQGFIDSDREKTRAKIAEIVNSYPEIRKDPVILQLAESETKEALDYLNAIKIVDGPIQ